MLMACAGLVAAEALTWLLHNGLFKHEMGNPSYISKAQTGLERSNYGMVYKFNDFRNREAICCIISSLTNKLCFALAVRPDDLQWL